MATVTFPVAYPSEDRNFVLLAGLCAAIAFSGFAATYWLPVAAGRFAGAPLVHLHGLLFSAWTLLFLSQASLIASGRFRSHRAWGLVGIALATAMVFTGVAVATASFQRRIELGFAEGGRAFLIVPISAVLLFAAFVTAAIVLRRHTDWHRRLMLAATASLLNAAIARFFFVASAGFGAAARPGVNPPRPVEFALVPGLIAASVVALAMLLDWRTRGRPHAAYVWALGLIVSVQFLRAPISRTEAWGDFADLLARFAG